jgi:hypothetical protein
MKASEFGFVALSLIGAFLLGTRFPNLPYWHRVPKEPTLEERVHNLNLQRTCADQADKFFKVEKEDKSNVFIGYINHYNSKLQKCFIHYSSVDYSDISSKGFVSTFENIHDVFEGVEYGSFFQRQNTKDTSPSAQLVTCTLTPPVGASHTCSSKTEWDEMISPYMKD